jgi:hypothetical protein
MQARNFFEFLFKSATHDYCLPLVNNKVKNGVLFIIKKPAILIEINPIGDIQ